MGKKKDKAPKPPATPPLDPALLEGIKHLIAYADDEKLQMDAAEMNTVADTAAAIAKQAGASDVTRHDLGMAGCVPPLVKLCALTHATVAQKDHAAHALALLTFNNPIVYGGSKAYMPEFVAFDHAKVILENQGVPPLLKMIGEGSPMQREHAAQCLSALANTAERRVSIMQAGALAPLLALLKEGSKADAPPHAHLAARQACMALASLAFCCEANQQLIRTSWPTRGSDLLQSCSDEINLPLPLRIAAGHALKNLSSVKPPPETAPVA